MKKSLLLSAAMVAALPALAVTDGQTYETKNDIKCINAWVIDRNHNSTEFEASPVGLNKNARTCAVKDGVAYVASWAPDAEVTVPDKDGNPVVQNAAAIHKYDVETGAYLGVVKLSKKDAEGNTIRHYGTGVANQIGFDSFGHMWISDMTFANSLTQNIFTVDIETGMITLVAELDKGGASARVDYCDVIGDITGAEGDCTVMAAGSSSIKVYGWTRSKGQTEWAGYFAGSTNMDFTEFYPSGAGNWSTGPSVKIVPGEGESEFWGDLYYIDGAASSPTLYNSTGAIADSFANATDCDQAGKGANGVVEFTVDGRDFIAYPNHQYEAAPGCEVKICELGEGMTFEGMKEYWTVPADGLGMVSDGGNRIHGLNREYVKNSDGSEYVNLFTFKCFNGFGLYKIGSKIESGVEGAIADKAAANITVNGNVIAVSEEAAEINVYNVAGQVVATAKNASEIAVPAEGAYIVKAVVAGAPVVKKVVL